MRRRVYRAFMMDLFSPGSQRKIDFWCSFAVDHLLYDALPVKEHIEIVTSHIHAQDVEHE
jgi:pyrroloquinoline quinone (PQQ) biosynthesis protein C